MLYVREAEVECLRKELSRQSEECSRRLSVKDKQIERLIKIIDELKSKLKECE